MTKHCSQKRALGSSRQLGAAPQTQSPEGRRRVSTRVGLGAIIFAAAITIGTACLSP
jgi:hypothetical protein